MDYVPATCPDAINAQDEPSILLDTTDMLRDHAPAGGCAVRL